MARRNKANYYQGYVSSPIVPPTTEDEKRKWIEFNVKTQRAPSLLTGGAVDLLRGELSLVQPEEVVTRDPNRPYIVQMDEKEIEKQRALLNLAAPDAEKEVRTREELEALFQERLSKELDNESPKRSKQWSTIKAGKAAKKRFEELPGLIAEKDKEYAELIKRRASEIQKNYRKALMEGFLAFPKNLYRNEVVTGPRKVYLTGQSDEDLMPRAFMRRRFLGA